MRTLTLLGGVTGVVGVIITLLTLSSSNDGAVTSNSPVAPAPQPSTSVTIPTLSEGFALGADGRALYDWLSSHKGQRVSLDIYLPASIIEDMSEGLRNHNQLTGSLQWFSMPANSRTSDGIEGFQVNLVGLKLDNLLNTFGWGGGGRYIFRGQYQIVERGIGTGGIAWVAMQAL